MSLLAAFSLSASAAAAPLIVYAPGEQATPANPTAAYVTAGQDEPGYRNWYMATPRHQTAVTSFNNYLQTYSVGGILPTWQLLRTASSWQRCGAQPFEVPPTSEWPHIVQTLRYVRDYVVPAVGPVEAVSAYRNPSLNVCAGGAPESAHKHYSAIDMVPLRPTTRQELMQTLCRVHGRRGLDYGVGLGFYAYLRFHVDTTKYRRWGADPDSVSCPPIIHPEDLTSVYQPPVATTSAATPPANTTAPLTVFAPPAGAVDPLAPAPDPSPPPATTPHRTGRSQPHP
jgi:hypothetical protein